MNAQQIINHIARGLVEANTHKECAFIEEACLAGAMCAEMDSIAHAYCGVIQKHYELRTQILVRLADAIEHFNDNR